MFVVAGFAALVGFVAGFVRGLTYCTVAGLSGGIAVGLANDEPCRAFARSPAYPSERRAHRFGRCPK